jgi:quercetin dioxygenase-like cupin family protein
LVPNELDENTKRAIQDALASVIHHGTRPLTPAEWQHLLEAEGFHVQVQAQAPMHLLEPWRLIRDEGLCRAIRFLWNMIRNGAARRRVRGMRRVFRKYRHHLAAVMLIGKKGECPTMATTYTIISDLAKEAQPPANGILSRTLYNDDRIKAVLFGFGQGEELSEHTASMPAVLHFLQGEARLTLGDDTIDTKPGTWVHMPAGLRHSIQTKTPVVMLLLLMKESHP